MGQIQSLDEFFGLLLRRKLLIAVVAVVGAVLSVLYALTRPVIFESVAVIQVESPTVTDSTGVAVASGSAQRLQTIEQRLTTRENMLEVIDRHGLYADLPLTNDEKVHLLRLALRFQPVASAAQAGYGAPSQVSALLIFAQADSAEKAARVANDFAQGMVDAGAQGQTSRAREALLFFAGEEKRLDGDIGRLEDEIAAFKNANADALPETRDQRQDEVATIETDLRRLDQSLLALTNERDRIVGSRTTLRATERRQIEDLDGQIEVAKAQRAALLAQQQTLQAALARLPQVERTLAAYDRTLGQLRSQFDVVTTRKTEAETAQKLEESQNAERFTLLERAVSPDYPITGGRKRLAMAGAVASVIAGIFAAFLMDNLHPVVRTRGQMERQLGLRPVVAIPDLRSIRPDPRPGAPVRPPVDSAKPGPDPRQGWMAMLRQLTSLPRHAVFGAVATVVVVAVVAAAALAG